MVSRLTSANPLRVRRPVTSILVPRRAAGSLPRLQAQLTDVGRVLEAGQANISPLLSGVPDAPRPYPEGRGLYTEPPAIHHIVSRNQPAHPHPVALVRPRDPDEFWRKIPVWENVSTDDFLSYRWGVSHIPYGKLPLFVSQIEHCVTSDHIGCQHGPGRSQALQVPSGSHPRECSHEQVGLADAEP